ncbi:class I SAM-dependent methyltransferase [Rhodoblastus acidophilus]|uniref:Class I SAM-dependent methyltransferase n=1 Tax=Candidatus Rhodoblastus alkanivorans TaxID=2954117 RepID=A0ABS9Z7J1_9HYPH|nr:class I SAM-dependent methyltransferase [Candidatus Rhodoblastus alkanivorans]MCI4678366.1 class I SAM-dependent methyltransferase [Candidatus Rhodoblastus alkanivorans]MCI4683624.1 class I SAM-dependent methyltransferase [Candidatus Rhodoblastus alkanivorans]MDI4640940.1 class I SAM-dependent methyltransferase [Rhodoblastus acidophilus]
MAIGAFLRRICGPYEHRVSEAYRSIYVHLDDFVAGIRESQPEAHRILEIGCGEGAVTERLAAAYPQAEILAIDITPRVGRLYRGPAGKVSFEQVAVQDVARKRPGQFDLIVLADVLHHAPPSLHDELLASAKAALAAGGLFVFKDGERDFTPIHGMCYASDRLLTGDRIRFMSATEMRERLDSVFGAAAIEAVARVAPWNNNLAFMVRG